MSICKKKNQEVVSMLFKEINTQISKKSQKWLLLAKGQHFSNGNRHGEGTMERDKKKRPYFHKS